MKYGFNPAAVYRFDFDNGFFYIGSSEKLKSRLNTWRTNIKRNIFQNKLIKDKLAGATSVVVSILEMPSAEILKLRETFYLRQEVESEFSLNRCTNGNDHTDIKPLPEYLRRPRKERKTRKPKGKFRPAPEYVWAFSKGVVQFTLKGEYVKSHKSISEAAKEVGVHERTINKHLKKSGILSRLRGINGFVFRHCGDNAPFFTTHN